KKGLSSSPSNTAEYPALVTAWDNVRAQKQLLSEVFGIDRVACVYGWSMGAQQAYHWAAAFPDQVDRIIAICGSAKTSVHNKEKWLGKTEQVRSVLLPTGFLVHGQRSPN
ncbi:MAG: alpha/beta fold hydrolase, partial [Betaproteobacteria bacterium]|nr:alpha/beta fold hydrolase [Betaproteobacteria bacterium]